MPSLSSDHCHRDAQVWQLSGGIRGLNVSLHVAIQCPTFPRKLCPAEVFLSSFLLILFASVRALWFSWLSPKLQPTGNTPQLRGDALLVGRCSARLLSVLARPGLRGALLWSVVGKIPMPEDGDESIM